MINLGYETEQIEYKKSTGELKEAVISIASILNKHGKGELYFGVKNNGDVIGQEISDSTLRDVSRAINEHIKPTIYPTVTIKDFDDKKVVYVKFEGTNAPYLAYNIPRIRVADEDKLMVQDVYSEMLKKRDNGKAWESQVSSYTVSDIIKEDFKSYLKKAKETNRITFESNDPLVVLNKLDLVAQDGIHLLNAGAVLFCNSSLNDVQMAKFATNVKATFTDIRKVPKGSIIGLCKVCEQYIVDAIDWKADIVGLKRIETPEIPLEAIREAIINSYGHRLYDNNQCNEIDVFKDRIEIHTTGGFPNGYEPSDFFDGNKKAIRRNKLITSVLYYSGDMETFATGLKRIKDLCDDAGCKLDFRTERDDFVVVFYRNLRESWNKNSQNKKIENGENIELKEGVTNQKLPRDYQETTKRTNKTTNKRTNKTTNKTLSRDYPETSQTLPRDYQDTTKTLPRDYQDTTKTTAEKIKDIMREDPTISASSIARSLERSLNTVQYHIKKMKASGEIERRGSDFGGKWIVKD